MKKILLNETEKKALANEKMRVIAENFAKNFNKIKRLNENELNIFNEEMLGQDMNQSMGQNINPEVDELLSLVLSDGFSLEMYNMTHITIRSYYSETGNEYDIAFGIRIILDSRGSYSPPNFSGHPDSWHDGDSEGAEWHIEFNDVTITKYSDSEEVIYKSPIESSPFKEKLTALGNKINDMVVLDSDIIQYYDERLPDDDGGY